MDTLISRYRSTLLLVVVIAVQFVLLAYQVRSDGDVRVIRVWAVTLVTPIANIAELVRGNVTGFYTNYVSLRDVRNDNRHMRTELGALKLENQFLRSELNTAERAKALASFEIRTPSKMIAARMIGAAGGPSNNVVFLDRGSTSGVQKGMAVVTPDGIVGEVVASFPTASQAVLVTDPGFAAGVISQKNKVRGVAKGISGGRCKVDFVPNEENVEPGEMFYTSGDDRVFPKGLPVGRVTVSRPGGSVREIFLDPAGLQNGPEEVLIILQGVHQPIPEEDTASQQVYLGTAAQPSQSTAPAPVVETDADRLREKYKQIGEAQNHVYGTGAIPNFNQKLAPKPAAAGNAPSTATKPAPTTVAKPPATPVGTAPHPVQPSTTALKTPATKPVVRVPNTLNPQTPRIGLATRPAPAKITAEAAGPPQPTLSVPNNTIVPHTTTPVKPRPKPPANQEPPNR